MSHNPIIELLHVGKYRLSAWRWAHRYGWTLLPERTAMWSGKLIYWSWGPFYITIDRRGDALDVLAQWCGKSRAETAAGLERKQDAAKRNPPAPSAET